jgi:hypothetical protein
MIQGAAVKGDASSTRRAAGRKRMNPPSTLRCRLLIAERIQRQEMVLGRRRGADPIRKNDDTARGMVSMIAVKGALVRCGSAGCKRLRRDR